ncbi:hypothetical protein [Halovivax limisalsi]|uniref:hypothetical protein n=1 Tax=Halovivax limisalsi TaxID=1453760 RepID=UPI001FFC4419|nr:hypothetical protein [Halovivax limisalsi]
MQTIEVTDAQHAFLTQLREELSREVVGRYGTCRDCDAVQFLIDHLDTDGDLTLDVDAGDGTTISFDGIDDELTTESAPNAADESGEDADDDSDEDADGESTDDASEEPADEGEAETGDDDAMLDKMMNLLDTHEEKWAESPAGDYRYRVELPDGGTEDVQTKDDVKAILFREY